MPADTNTKCNGRKAPDAKAADAKAPAMPSRQMRRRPAERVGSDPADPIRATLRLQG